MQAVESSSDGLVRIGPATLYGTLRRLVDEGLAEEVAKPLAFRREFGDDMLLLFDSLVADRGILAATSRTSLDLIVTVPRYRLETVMTDSRATQVLTATIAGLLVLGFISRWRVYPGPVRS